MATDANLLTVLVFSTQRRKETRKRAWEKRKKEKRIGEEKGRGEKRKGTKGGRGEGTIGKKVTERNRKERHA